MSHDDAKYWDGTLDMFEKLDPGEDKPPASGPPEAKPQSAKAGTSRPKKKRTASDQLPDEDVSSVFLTDEDVARRFRVARQTIWRWAGEGRLPAPLKLSPGTSRWRLAEILSFERKLPRHSPGLASKNAKRKRT